MKTLQQHITDETTECIRKHHAFFAFSTDQFNAKRLLCVSKYISINAGLIAPATCAKSLLLELNEIQEKGIARDISENGKESIIKRELANHEFSYTGSTEDTEEALAKYPITPEEIQTIAHMYNAQDAD